MEILNNISAYLNTPNDIAINIILVICTFFENYLILLLFASILNVYLKKEKVLLYILVTSIFSLITMFLIPTPFNVFINYFMAILLQFTIFKQPFLKSLVSTVLSLVIFNLIGILILNPFITLFNINTDQLNSIPIYRIYYLLTIYLITTILILILKNKNLKFYFSESIDKKNKIIIITNLFLGIFALILQSITLFYYVDTLPIIITFLSFISLLAYFSVSIYSLSRIFKLVLTTQKLESAEEYNRSLCILHDSARTFKHDFDNIVTTIGGFIRTNDMEGLKDYYSELEDHCQKVNNL